MAIRVPVNPETEPVAKFESFTPEGRAHDVTGVFQGASDLGQSIQAVRDRKIKELKQQDAFDLHRKVLETTNQRDADFAERVKSADPGAPNFAERLNSDYAAETQQFIQDATKAGYDKDAIRVFSDQLQSLNNSYHAKAIAFQTASEEQHGQVLVNDDAEQAAQYASMHPEDGAESAREHLRTSINLNPFISAADKEKVFQEKVAAVDLAAGVAYGMNKPKETLQALAPQFLPKPVAPAATAAGSGGTNSDPWKQAIISAATAVGVDPAALAAVAHKESSFKPTVDNGQGYVGLIQMSAANQKHYGVNKNSTPEQWATAIASYLKDAGVKPGMGVKDIYGAVLTGHVDPAKYDIKDSNGTSVNNSVADLQGKHTQAGTAWLNEGRAAAAAPVEVPTTDIGVRPEIEGNLPVDDRINGAIPIETDQGQVLIPTHVDGKVLTPEEATARYNNTHEHFGVFATAEQANQYSEKFQSPPKSDEPFPQEKLPPALKHLTGQQRLAVINSARDALRTNDTQARASIQQNVENAVTANQAGRPYTGPMQSKEEMQAVLGEVQGAAAYAKVEASKAAQPIIAGMTTSSNTALQAQVSALEPTDTSDPAYADKHAVWQATAQAAASNLKAREADPMTYIMTAFPSVHQALVDAKTPEQRSAAYKQLQQSYVQLGIPEGEWLPVPKAQVAQLAQNYDNMTAEQKMSQLHAWSTEMGPKLWVPFMVEMNGHDGAGPGYDMFMMNQLQSHPQFRQVMNQIFAGQLAIKEDPARKPSPAIVDQLFAETLGTAIVKLNPTTSRIYNQAATAMFVARGGRVGKDSNGVDQLLVGGNKDLFVDSLRQVVGGLKDNPDTGMYKFHGSKEPATILPPNWTRQRWSATLQQQTLQSLTNNSAGGKPPLTKFGNQPSMQSIIDDGVFVMTAPGQYVIKFEGQEGVLVDRTGAPFVLKVRP